MAYDREFPKELGAYDNARPDAPAPELAQVEPRPGRAWRSSSSTFPISCSDPTPTPPPTDTVAVVEGHEITADEFRRTYQAQLQAYRHAYGGNMSEQLLKQLGVDQQILQQMVDERAALAEAERLGIRVSDEEVRQRILVDPGVPGERRVHRRAALPAAARACSGRR